MKTITKTIRGRKFDFREDGTVYAHPHKDRLNRKWKGRVLAQSIRGKKYLASCVSVDCSKVSFYAHRVACEVSVGDEFDPSLDVDHIDGDKLNNSPSNLRQLTKHENSLAYHRATHGAVSKYRGVSPSSRSESWVASITKRRKSICIGTFMSEQHAAIAYDSAAEAIGFDAAALNRTNFSEISEMHEAGIAPVRMTKFNQGGASMFCGVYKGRGNRWFSQIGRNNKYNRIGTFDTEVEAALAYDAKAEEVGRQASTFNRNNHESIMEAYKNQVTHKNVSSVAESLDRS